MIDLQQLIQDYESKKTECQKNRMGCDEKANFFRKRAEHYTGVAARMMQRARKCNAEAAKYKYPDWIKTVLVPVIRALNKELGTSFKTTDLHSFGLRGEVPVSHAYGTEREMSLLFTFDFGKLYVDTGKKNDNVVVPGSIAEANRFHFIREEVTNIDILVNNLKRRFPHNFKS